MLRDPFDIHRKNIFQVTANRAAQNIRDTAAQVGANALDMSFAVPRNVPDFGGPGREQEDNAWSSLRGAGARAKDRVNGMFDKDALPMYKDKPFTYTPSYRNRPWWKKKRMLSGIFTSVLFLVYMLGIFSEPQAGQSNPSARPGWSWIGLSDSAGKDADWGERRERVVQAFEVSWDAYERYAWGTYRATARAFLNVHSKSWLTRAGY